MTNEEKIKKYREYLIHEKTGAEDKAWYWVLQIASILIVLVLIGILVFKEDMSAMNIADAIIHLFLSIMLCVFIRSKRKWL